MPGSGSLSGRTADRRSAGVYDPGRRLWHCRRGGRHIEGVRSGSSLQCSKPAEGQAPAGSAVAVGLRRAQGPSVRRILTRQRARSGTVEHFDVAKLEHIQARLLKKETITTSSC